MAKGERNQNITTEELLAQWDAARWSVACREMQIRISRGCFEAAHRALSHFCRDTQPDFATLESHVSSVLPVRLANMLEEAGYSTLRSVDNELDETLLRIENFGTVSVNTCRKIIAAVRSGTVPEISPDDGYDELIDSEHSYHLRTFNNFRPDINQTQEHRVMTASERIKEAMSLLMADTTGALEVLDKEIAQHESEIDRLKSMRKLLGGEPKTKARCTKLTPKLAKLEARIFDVISRSGPTLVEDLAMGLSESRLAIGMAVARSERLDKDGKAVIAAGVA